MKKLLFFGLVSTLLISCSKNDKADESIETGIVGKYQLVEVYSDPGDGSGTFQPVNSNKTVEFLSTGVVVSNGNMCDLGAGTSSSTSGTFSLTDSTISSSDCYGDLWFELNNNELIIYLQCIEGCGSKYIRQ